MTGAKTMAGIKTEFEPLVRCPVEVPLLEPFPFETVNRIKIPRQYIYSQIVVFLAQPIQK